MIHIVGVDKVYSMLDWEDQRPHTQQAVIALHYSIAREVEVGKIVFMLTCSCNKKERGFFFLFFFLKINKTTCNVLHHNTRTHRM